MTLRLSKETIVTLSQEEGIHVNAGILQTKHNCKSKHEHHCDHSKHHKHNCHSKHEHHCDHSKHHKHDCHSKKHHC